MACGIACRGVLNAVGEILGPRLDTPAAEPVLGPDGQWLLCVRFDGSVRGAERQPLASLEGKAVAFELCIDEDGEPLASSVALPAGGGFRSKNAPVAAPLKSDLDTFLGEGSDVSDGGDGDVIEPAAQVSEGDLASDDEPASDPAAVVMRETLQRPWPPKRPQPRQSPPRQKPRPPLKNPGDLVGAADARVLSARRRGSFPEATASAFTDETMLERKAKRRTASARRPARSDCASFETMDGVGAVGMEGEDRVAAILQAAVQRQVDAAIADAQDILASSVGVPAIALDSSQTRADYQPEPSKDRRKTSKASTHLQEGSSETWRRQVVRARAAPEDKGKRGAGSAKRRSPIVGSDRESRSTEAVVRLNRKVLNGSQTKRSIREVDSSRDVCTAQRQTAEPRSARVSLQTHLEVSSRNAVVLERRKLEERRKLVEHGPPPPPPQPPQCSNAVVFKQRSISPGRAPLQAMPPARPPPRRLMESAKRDYNQEQEAEDDAPGLYRVLHNHTVLKEDVSRESAVVCELQRGVEVDVLQLKWLCDEGRVRGSVAAGTDHAAGWISVLNLDSGHRWCRRIGGSAPRSHTHGRSRTRSRSRVRESSFMQARQVLDGPKSAPAVSLRPRQNTPEHESRDGATKDGCRSSAVLLPAKSQVELCSLWQKNRCYFGDSCRFSHDGEGGSTGHRPFSVVEPPVILRPRQSTASAEAEDEGDREALLAQAADQVDRGEAAAAKALGRYWALGGAGPAKDLRAAHSGLQTALKMVSRHYDSTTVHAKLKPLATARQAELQKEFATLLKRLKDKLRDTGEAEQEIEREEHTWEPDACEAQEPHNWRRVTCSAAPKVEESWRTRARRSVSLARRSASPAIVPAPPWARHV